MFHDSTQENNQAPAAAIAEVKGASTRRRFLRGSLVGVAALAPVGVLAVAAPQFASAAPASSYHLSAEKAFQEIMSDENAHVAFLKQALSGSARPKPTFKGLRQWKLSDFLHLSQAFENTGVGAYLLAAPAIQNKGYLAAVGAILTIEARHAGYIDAYVRQPLSPNGAFDKPIAQADIVKAVAPFIASLNGGPDPAAPLKNDTDILNFALLL